MIRGRFALLAMVLLVVAFLFPSCAEPLQPTLEVAPASVSLVTGQVVQLTVTRRFPGGAVEDVTHRVAYATSDRLIAGVDGNGVVTAGSKEGSALVRVVDMTSDATGATSFSVSAPKVDAIVVSPSPASMLARGETRQFSATAHFTNGRTEDVTARVTWSTSNTAIATVTAGGLVSGVSPGEVNVAAVDPTSGIRGVSTLFVTSGTPQLKALLVTPNPGQATVATTLQFSALGVMSDGTTVDMTAQVGWSSSRVDIATISAAGLLTAVAAGDTTITATGPEPSTTVKGSAAAKVVP